MQANIWIEKHSSYVLHEFVKYELPIGILATKRPKIGPFYLEPLTKGHGR